MSPEAPKDYIHVRARRGQATDSHSLAKRLYYAFVEAVDRGNIRTMPNRAIPADIQPTPIRYQTIWRNRSMNTRRNVQNKQLPRKSINNYIRLHRKRSILSCN